VRRLTPGRNKKKIAQSNLKTGCIVGFIFHSETGKSRALQTDHTTATLALEIAHPLTLLKMTLFGFPKVKWLHLTGEVDNQ